MIDYGTVRSSVSPDPIVIDDHSVWVHADIRPYTEQTDQGEEKGFEYTMKRYEKDEYIRMMDEKNADLEDQVTSTQIALCDVYEMML